MEVFQPSSLAEALDLMASADEPLTPIAGGTDLFAGWHRVDKDGLRLLNLSRLSELRRMRLTDDGLELGGLTTYWQVIASPQVTAAFPLLAESAKLIGAIQIQTLGTWAGNIANGSPAADGVLVMMAYDATVVLQSHEGITEVPLDEYYLGYKKSVRRSDQLITAIRMPRRPRRVEWFEKVASRRVLAISKLGVAVVRDDLGWRVVANSVAPIVCRCRTLEKALEEDHRFDSPDEVLGLLEPDISPISDIRSTEAYRRRVLSRILYFRFAGSGS
ncbi:MAG: FAD binding domain-containing protein [Planctomycetota bacterium]